MARYYFTSDGTYGIVDNDFVIISTDGFTDEMFDEIDSASDSTKIEYALMFRDLIDINSPKPFERTQWAGVEGYLDEAIHLAKSEGMLELSSILEEIYEGLGF